MELVLVVDISGVSSFPAVVGAPSSVGKKEPQKFLPSVVLPSPPCASVVKLVVTRPSEVIGEAESEVGFTEGGILSTCDVDKSFDFMSLGTGVD